MVNKILISKEKRKILHRDKRFIGMEGENLQEVLLFCLDKKIEGIGMVEVELPNGQKGLIEVNNTNEGYELPIKSSLLTQSGFVRFQLRIIQNNEIVFKSDVIELEVKDSINAADAIPDEYPSWVEETSKRINEIEEDLQDIKQNGISGAIDSITNKELEEIYKDL